MGKYIKKKAAKQRKVLTAAIGAISVVLVLLIVVLLCLGRDKAPEATVPGTEAPVTEQISNMKELLVESSTERGEVVTVETTYGTVKYPYAFSDLIIVEAETFENHAALTFKAELDGEQYNLYTLLFNGEEEDSMPLGELLVDGETYVVTALFHDVTGLSDDNMVTFYAVQETFNDVVNSLSENSGFTAED